jgi:hypothetical protein
MKSLIQAIGIAAVLAVPVASFAQSNQPLTRAEVRAQLVQLEQAGYRPTGDHASYPNQIEAAEAKVAAENAAAQARGADTSGVGGTVSGSSASGAPTR